MLLTAVGIRPNVDLARDAGIPVARGVLVDDRMQTQVPDVYAAGDVAEHRGVVHGLWPIAAEQARAAALNALGGDVRVAAETPATILKGVGLELFATGQVDAGDEVIVVERAAPASYRRLVLSEGRAVGAVILGSHPADRVAAQVVVRQRCRDSAGRLRRRAGRRLDAAPRPGGRRTRPPSTPEAQPVAEREDVSTDAHAPAGRRARRGRRRPGPTRLLPARR